MLRVFEFIINEEDKELGMKAISLVDKPAMESEFIAFNKEVKPKMFKFQDASKRIVAGLALIPNKLVYRVDEETDEEYLGYFSEATIETIMNKFMREAVDGTTENVNLQHNSGDKVQAHLIESFILRTPEMVTAVQAMGIEDAVLGAWFVSYKFDNEEAYNLAVSGGYTGFSIEIMLQRELKLNKNNKNNNNNKFMKKVKNFIAQFKTLLEEIEGAGIFEDVVVPDSGKSLRFGEIGQPVVWVTVDEAGVEATEPATEGQYVLEDGRTVTVDAQGNLAEISDAGSPVAPINPEDLAKYPWDKCIADNTPKYGKDGAAKICGKIKANNSLTVEQALAELAKDGDIVTELAVSGDTAQPAVSGDTAMPPTEVSAKTLGEIVDVSKDGKYSIEVVVAGGVITEATVEAAQNLIAEADFNAQKTLLEAANAEIARLKAELEKPIVKPAFVEYSTVSPKSKTKDELAKMSNIEIVKNRLNLK